MIAVRFADLGWPVVSPLISRFSGHWTNHCDLMTSCIGVIAALPLHGVKERLISKVPAVREEFVRVACTEGQAAKAIAFARDQVGKSYDYGGVFSWSWGAGWQDSRRWFCSELTAAALAHAGIITAPQAHRLSPGDLYRILKQGNPHDHDL